MSNQNSNNNILARKVMEILEPLKIQVQNGPVPVPVPTSPTSVAKLPERMVPQPMPMQLPPPLVEEAVPVNMQADTTTTYTQDSPLLSRWTQTVREMDPSTLAAFQTTLQGDPSNYPETVKPMDNQTIQRLLDLIKRVISEKNIEQSTAPEPVSFAQTTPLGKYDIVNKLIRVLRGIVNPDTDFKLREDAESNRRLQQNELIKAKRRDEEQQKAVKAQEVAAKKAATKAEQDRKIAEQANEAAAAAEVTKVEYTVQLTQLEQKLTNIKNEVAIATNATIETRQAAKIKQQETEQQIALINASLVQATGQVATLTADAERANQAFRQQLEESRAQIEELRKQNETEKAELLAQSTRTIQENEVSQATALSNTQQEFQGRQTGLQNQLIDMDVGYQAKLQEKEQDIKMKNDLLDESDELYRQLNEQYTFQKRVSQEQDTVIKKQRLNVEMANKSLDMARRNAAAEINAAQAALDKMKNESEQVKAQAKANLQAIVESHNRELEDKKQLVTTTLNFSKKALEDMKEKHQAELANRLKEAEERCTNEKDALVQENDALKQELTLAKLMQVLNNTLIKPKNGLDDDCCADLKAQVKVLQDQIANIFGQGAGKDDFFNELAQRIEGIVMNPMNPISTSITAMNAKLDEKENRINTKIEQLRTSQDVTIQQITGLIEQIKTDQEQQIAAITKANQALLLQTNQGIANKLLDINKEHFAILKTLLDSEITKHGQVNATVAGVTDALTQLINKNGENTEKLNNSMTNVGYELWNSIEEIRSGIETLLPQVQIADPVIKNRLDLSIAQNSRIFNAMKVDNASMLKKQTEMNEKIDSLRQQMKVSFQNMGNNNADTRLQINTIVLENQQIQQKIDDLAVNMTAVVAAMPPPATDLTAIAKMIDDKLGLSKTKSTNPFDPPPPPPRPDSLLAMISNLINAKLAVHAQPPDFTGLIPQLQNIMKTELDAKLREVEEKIKKTKPDYFVNFENKYDLFQQNMLDGMTHVSEELADIKTKVGTAQVQGQAPAQAPGQAPGPIGNMYYIKDVK